MSYTAQKKAVLQAHIRLAALTLQGRDITAALKQYQEQCRRLEQYLVEAA